MNKLRLCGKLGRGRKNRFWEYLFPILIPVRVLF
jgi:hypothetical protein